MAEQTRGIVIVGGGAGGVELAARLAKAGRSDVLLIDQNPTHVWKPRLHELAGGARRGTVDELDYAGLAEHWGFAFEQGELADIDPDSKTVSLAPINDVDGETVVKSRTRHYRLLVLALGGVTPDLGVDGVREHAAVLDRADDAEALYLRFSHGLLARAQPSDDAPLNIVIVGTGLTGVELAAHMANDHMCTAFAPRSAMPRIKVTLLEAVDTFMPGMDETVRESVRQRLEASDIDIRTGQQVSRIESDAVVIDDNTRFPADLTVWTTGRVGPPIADTISALETNKKRQWIVRDTLQTRAYDDIFALGDCAYIESDPAPPTAQAASEQAEHLAEQVVAYLDGKTPAAFEFEDKGTLLSLGEGGSVGKVRGYFGDDLQVRGRLSRAAYRGLERQHQMVLLGTARATTEAIGDVFGRTVGARLKVH